MEAGGLGTWASSRRSDGEIRDIAGAIGLAAYSLYKVAWPQFALNLFWGAVAVIGIIIAVIAARKLTSGAPAASPEFDERGVREG